MRIYHLTQIENHVEGIVGSISSENPRQCNCIKNCIRRYQKGFLAEEWERFPSLKGKTSTSKDFLKYEWELYLKQHLTPPRHNIIAWIIKLAIDIGWWSSGSISRDRRLCHFCSYKEWKTRHTLCWIINPLEMKFSSLFENVVLGSLKFSNQENSIGARISLTLN